ncbi:MAG: hypothetical protein NVSMB57_07220 [Actinomycetota bacterium]
MNVPANLPVEDPGFIADCREAVRAWKAFPQLVVFTLALGIVLVLPPAWRVVTLPLVILEIGWHGASRMLYLRAFRGRPAAGREIWAMTKAYIGRFIVAGLILAIPMIVVSVLFLFVFRGDSPVNGTPRAAQLQGWYLLTMFALGLVVDVILTFVTPALAFSTRKAGEAYRIGLGMIKRTWPACALYVIVPPLAIQIAATGSAARQTLPLLAIAIAFLVRILGLMLQGATARFYLRRVEVGDNGAYKHPEAALPPPPLPPDRATNI